MTESADAERAYYFQDLSSRAIARAAELCRGSGAPAQGGDAPGKPCGDDLDRNDLDLIEAAIAGRCAGLSPWQEAQMHEIGFWRSVALHGYAGKSPQLFPLHQELLMVSTFYRTGWTMGEFRNAAVVELGCGPLGMIEYLPAARRVAFDPLNDKYSRLFAGFRSSAIEYVSDRDAFAVDRTEFEFGICHNVLDHTDDPAAWFNLLFAKIRTSGRFIFQVNLSKAETLQSAQYRRMHPSPIAFEQAVGWLAAKSADFDYFCEAEANRDGEFYFLSWGTKTHDEPVVYRRLVD